MKFVRSLVLIMSLFSSHVAFSQEGEADILATSMKDVTVVAATGVGGAILGLSTLSFVDEPSEHLKNIIVGGAVGIIIGVGVVAWLAATKSKDMYQADGKQAFNSEDFSGSDRNVWHKFEHEARSSKKPHPHFSYSFNF